MPSQLPFLLLWGTVSVGLWQAVQHGGGAGKAVGSGIFALLSFLTLAQVLRRQYFATFCLLAYMAATEPALRGYGERLPYLTLEYVAILSAFFAMLQRRAKVRLPVVFLSLYVLVEVAGVAIAADNEDARWMTVMTGAMLAYMLIAQRTDLRPEHTLRVLATFVAGTLAISAMALQGSFKQEVEWTTQSNWTSSGGFGPNQAGMLMAFGAFACILLADIERKWLSRSLYLMLAAVQTLAALLTFTRGAGYLLAAGLFVYVLILLAQGRFSVALLGGVLVLAAAGWFAVQHTGEVLMDRYQEEGMSRREEIWALGLRIFWHQPLFGVGTGNFFSASQGLFAFTGGRVGSHNEFIRALAEHGIVGASLWIAFGVSVLWQSWRESRGLIRASTVVWLLMAVGYQCHSGLKLAMPMVFIALAAEGFRVHGARRISRVSRLPEGVFDPPAARLPVLTPHKAAG